MKFTIENCLNLSDTKDTIKKMNFTFDSHEFINQFREDFPEQYRSLADRYTTIGHAHARIGSYLSKFRTDLNIESIGRTLSANVRGGVTSCELWRKL